MLNLAHQAEAIDQSDQSDRQGASATSDVLGSRASPRRGPAQVVLVVERVATQEVERVHELGVRTDDGSPLDDRVERRLYGGAH